jgi:glutathione S-transferase
MIKIFHSRRTRSARVIWLLEELSVPYELVHVEFKPEVLKGEEHKKVHPLGQVPAIQEGDLTMFESGAIVEYLLEKYGGGRLTPAAGSQERAEYLQWFHYGEASLAKYMSEIVRYRFRETDLPEQVLERSRSRFVETVAVVERALDGRAYICGAQFSAADIMVAYGLIMARIIRELPAEFTRVADYLSRLKERPGYERAWS